MHKKALHTYLHTNEHTEISEIYSQELPPTCTLVLIVSSETRAAVLYFRSVFDTVNHRALIYKIQSIGVGGMFSKSIIGFLTMRQ